MIGEEKTFEMFGYYSKNLGLYSSKKIIAACNDCEKQRIIRKDKYHDLCKSCSHKGKKLSAETRKKNK